MKKKEPILVDNSIYNEADLLGAVSILSNNYIIELSKKKRGTLVVASSRFSDSVDDNFRDRFFDVLNDQKIRNKINIKVQKVRDLIVGKALYETGSFDNESEIFMKDKSKLDYMEDKNKIATLFK